MRLLHHRTAPPRRASLAHALVMAAALLTLPPLAADSEAARAVKPTAARQQAEPSRAKAGTPARPKAARPGREAARGKVALRSKVEVARGKAAKPAPPQVSARLARQAARRPPSRPVPVAASPAEPEVPGLRRVVVSALGGAVRSTGIDPALLTALAWQESRFDPRAKNRRSTARGLMQFTEASWLEAVRDHGPRHGLVYESAVLSTNPASGTISTRHPRTRLRILDLRDNPRHAAVLAAARINRARASLELALLRPVGPADLYMVHLLGPAGAQRFLAALDRTPNRPAAEVVAGDSVAMNRELFFERGTGRKVSLAELHAWVARAIAGQREQHADLMARLGGNGVMEMASAP
ncbi:transglycosylase SLT domain-containing protein [Roseicella aquatilis]|uniref:Transglycosylase SLT domain-containing protein n=1 Tax=Roseicella aquatilis TaxID=2527868 RepID=A0A4R4DVP7_9PROT|nr:transglycosylase SLT domain-containing protein [Roseicella aquatilis]TCZ66190.1 hypothetical protein EXY23_03715 [Roseicella aquatilis]